MILGQGHAYQDLNKSRQNRIAGEMARKPYEIMAESISLFDRIHL